MALQVREQKSDLLLSIVVPLLNEEEVVELLLSRLRRVVDSLAVRVEMVFVNDGSRDHTLDFLMRYSGEDERIKILDLSRNFGHQVAITAGMDFARGDVIILMDGDLQDPPELIPRMLDLYQEGYDVVYAKRRQREGESWFKRVTARFFYRLMRRMTAIDLPDDTGDFRLISRAVLDALLSMREQHRYLRGMVRWVGFQQKELLFDREPRAAGRTKFNFGRMMRFALDAIFSFSPTPLRLITVLGLLNLFVGILYLAYNLYLHFYKHVTVPGWTSIVFLQVCLSGALLIAVGVIGEYIARIFEEIKQRPLYIVKQAINIDTFTRRERTVVSQNETSKLT